MSGTFADLGLPADLIDVLARQRITEPFEIQRATIPDGLAGRDVLGRAPTGSGKTLAFGLPLVARLDRAEPRRPTALILSPTRELAEQIKTELEPLVKERGQRALAVYGGVGFGAQVHALRQGVDLLVACPGRLIDLIDQGEVSLDQVNQVVIDEADRMADMGFLPPVRRLLDLTSPTRQTTLFSATLDDDVQILTDQYQNDPVRHEFGPQQQTLDRRASHRFIRTSQSIKVGLAADVVTETGTTIIFCRTRHGVDRVARQLRKAGVKAGWIHGGRSQNQRDAALDAFTSGRVVALVATDVAARGIHVDDVAGVIHFDPPEDAKTYIHRSGRTARAGAAGRVVSFVNDDQTKQIRRMQRELGLPEAVEDTPEITPDDQRPAPVREERPTPAPARPKRSNGSGRAKRNGRANAQSSARGGAQASGRTTAAERADGRSTGPSRADGSRRVDGSRRGQGPNRSTAAGGPAGASSGRLRPRGGSDTARGAEEASTVRPGRPNAKRSSGRASTGAGAQRRPGSAAGGGAKAKTATTATKRSGKPRPKMKRRNSRG